jgi:hypothetical protein
MAGELDEILSRITVGSGKDDVESAIDDFPGFFVKRR